MSALQRYSRVGRLAQALDVTVDRAIDPITGLSVLVYRFPGAPVAEAEGLDPGSFWAVLEAGTDASGGFVVSNLHDGASRISERPTLLDQEAAAAAFEAVATAVEAGAVHGDLGTHRIYRRGDQVWLEGYGVPWRERTTDEDVRTLARAMLELEGSRLSGRARAALERATEHGDARRAADELAEEGAGDHEGAAAGRGARRSDVGPVDPGAAEAITFDAPTPRERGERNAASRAFDEVRLDATVTEDEPPARPRWSRDEPPTGPAAVQGTTPTRHASTPRRSAPPPARPTATAAPTFSKAPPPDVRYRHADDAAALHDVDEPAGDAHSASPRDRRRLWLLGVLVLAAMILALLVVLSGRGTGLASGAGAGTGAFVVDVRISPERHPPVSLVVVSSPGGSMHAAGTVLGSVPRRVVLDREGTWQLQGRFGDTRSAITTVVVPRDAVAVLAFPAGAP